MALNIEFACLGTTLNTGCGGMGMALNTGCARLRTALAEYRRTGLDMALNIRCA
jgi:hypothetical protein